MGETPGVGRRVQVDGHYVLYVGKIKGRKGEWLGLRMDEVVGDCDGSIGNDRYFTCENAQGLFIKWESGRLVPAPERADLPEPVLAHMLMLFEMCDARQTGGLDVNELRGAMQMLGMNVAKTDVQAMFKKLVTDEDRVATRKDAIEFDEFRQLMEEQWAGVDLGAVVQSIVDDEDEEQRRQAEAKLAVLEHNLTVDICGATVDLKYFDVGTNVALVVVYSFLALALTMQIYLDVPEDKVTLMMVFTLGGSAVLFGIGAVAIRQSNWALVKMYSVLLFFAGGLHVAVCIVVTAGTLHMSTSAAVAVMDRECGTCIGGGRCHTIGSSVSLQDIQQVHEQPWYCCCAHNECYASEVSDPVSHISLSDKLQTAKDTCQHRDEYMAYARLWAYPMQSVLGEERCFERAEDPNLSYGGLVGCLESYQSSTRMVYLVFQVLMLPILLVAAYVGWVLPDIYIGLITQSEAQGVDSFLSTLEANTASISNPMNEDSSTVRNTVSAQGQSQRGDDSVQQVRNKKFRYTTDRPAEVLITDAFREAKQAKRDREKQEELRTLGPYLSGQTKPTNAIIAKTKANTSTPVVGPRICGTVPGSQAEEAGVRKGWVLHSINGKVVNSQHAEKVIVLLRNNAERPLSVKFYPRYHDPVDVVFRRPGELGLKFQSATTSAAHDDSTSKIGVSNPLQKVTTKTDRRTASIVSVSNPLMDQLMDDDE